MERIRISPSKIAEKVKRYYKGALLAGGSAVAAVAVVACGGESEGARNNGETPTIPPSPERTVEPTATVTPTVEPTPEPTEFAPKKLSEAQFEPTTYEQMVEAVNDAYDARPDLATIKPYPGSETTRSREKFLKLLNQCGYGSLSDRMNQCAVLPLLSRALYIQSEYDEMYQAQVKIANYILTEFPERKADFDAQFTYNNIDDSLPSLPK